MTFTAAELAYLAGQPLGRLATAQPDGTLQVSPVGFRYNSDLATIDIGGWNMAASRKYRNVAANGRAAFVVDDLPSVDPWRVRCLEIRGVAEAVQPAGGEAIIRIHPRRIISFGIDDPDSEPHALVPSNRDVVSR
ncbi:PPOX class F420-dependent oxidoreductase [Actinoplanes auranticolor]|uniref:PPOX class F420-dependent oxidoreductase n=1 Tax=Actinoplanes auranticolor TaxID=47988 RepID=A0A919VWZ0_9ACTN|nr:PPOX class F420-dependent oxidoreductase [Actinoplanes auranticolor]GIM80066.1 PPOX class F420-dependent oxidoreductase [Actinoplanes auranticolor]